MKHSLFILFLFASAIIQAQVIGFVFDANTKEPLEYATIYCKAEGTGTVSNREGRFALFLKDPESEVSVSYMGYNTVKGKLSSKSEIPLRRATILLAEHTVTPIKDVEEVLISVKKQYKKNHHVNKTICDVHLKQFYLADGKYIKSIDMIGELEIPVVKNLKKEDKFRLSAVSAELYEDTTALQAVIVFPKYVLAAFSNPYTVVYIMAALTNRYNFQTTRIYQDNSFVYKIDFSYKKEKKYTGRISGTIFIDEKTKAILEFECHQNTSFEKEQIAEHNGETLVLKKQERGVKISYLKMDNNEYLMAYAIEYSRNLLNEEQRDFYTVLSNTNFKKSSFNNQYPINISEDLFDQLLEMNLARISQGQNRIIPTKEETEFFNKNK